MAWKARHATLPLKNLRGQCCIAMASCFAVCSSARVSQLHGTIWGEFTAAGKRAARFAAAISWRGTMADNFLFPQPTAFLVFYPKPPRGGDRCHLKTRGPPHL